MELSFSVYRGLTIEFFRCCVEEGIKTGLDKFAPILVRVEIKYQIAH